MAWLVGQDAEQVPHCRHWSIFSPPGTARTPARNRSVSVRACVVFIHRLQVPVSVGRALADGRLLRSRPANVDGTPPHRDSATPVPGGRRGAAAGKDRQDRGCRGPWREWGRAGWTDPRLSASAPRISAPRPYSPSLSSLSRKVDAFMPSMRAAAVLFPPVALRALRRSSRSKCSTRC